MGRDMLFDLLSAHKLLVKKKKAKDQHHPITALAKKISNLIKEWLRKNLVSYGWQILPMWR